VIFLGISGGSFVIYSYTMIKALFALKGIWTGATTRKKWLTLLMLSMGFLFVLVL